MLIGQEIVKVLAGVVVSMMVMVSVVPLYVICTCITSPLCRLGTPAGSVVGLGQGAAAVQAAPASVVAGTVGVAPFVYKPVELLPSPAWLYRSTFTATLEPMPAPA